MADVIPEIDARLDALEARVTVLEQAQATASATAAAATQAAQNPAAASPAASYEPTH